MNKNNDSGIRYTSTLRLKLDNAEGLFERLEKYGKSFDRVAFLTSGTHSVRGLTYYRALAERLRPLICRLKEMNIEVGINEMITLGFFKEAPDAEMADMRYSVSLLDGELKEGRLCPTAPASLEYIREKYRIFASLKPNFIYIDDDMSNMTCACDSCIARFSELYPDVLDGKSADRQALTEALEAEEPKKREEARRSWLAYNSLRIEELYTVIENTVHAEEPSVSLEAMTYFAGTERLDADRWAVKLRGNTDTTVGWRPGGGVYTDKSVADVLKKAYRMSVQTRFLPSFVKRIEGEIENFPFQALHKSPSFTAFEAFIYQAACCTGTAFDVLANEVALGTEHDAFFEMAQNAFEYGERLTGAFGTRAVARRRILVG